MIWQHQGGTEFLKPSKGMHVFFLPQNLRAFAAYYVAEITGKAMNAPLY